MNSFDFKCYGYYLAAFLILLSCLLRFKRHLKINKLITSELQTLTCRDIKRRDRNPRASVGKSQN